MRFLVDQNQSPLLTELLNAAGHDAVHVRDLGLGAAADTSIMSEAVASDRIVVSGDTDFGALLARTNAGRPTIILLRRQGDRRAADTARLLLANLDSRITVLLEFGAIVVLNDDRVRVRALPLGDPLDPFGLAAIVAEPDNGVDRGMEQR